MRTRRDHNYAEPESNDAEMEEDSDEMNKEENSEVMQQGYLCTSADPRRIGEEGGEPFIITPNELRDIIVLQQTTDDQTIWMTTAQAGFPLTRNEDEVTNSKDAQMGRTTSRYLHPVISTFRSRFGVVRSPHMDSTTKLTLVGS